ncbi:spore gernimation protein [Paenibacillus sp. FSL R7-0273]|uniref:GerAB/ArcD/ProY family transporter n=1 Tax=Paenibacillus sp. FSL R7-0273 TaxID=1536772 RepID=UPI0004F6E5C3|nr:endospore germination permease [Paenibacillus sp. FSL R7-0273]AIQ49016.1 spore gernimation protein [Paenibacillus sp. FSL R7-0273]OMF90575.1 spore gernimation protein [Paenibacillus sp. FSL R7-0273]
MKRQTGISALQFFILTFGFTIGTSILVTPSGIAHIAREDAWIASLVSMLINLIMVLLYIALSRLYPGQSLYEILESVIGKWPGKLLTLVYLFYFISLTGTLLGNLGFFVSGEVMPETPPEVVQIIFLIAAIISARKGLIIVARVGELFFPWVVVLLLILILALVPQIEWNYIKPVLEEGWMPVLQAGLQTSIFQELIVLMVFLPLVKRNKPRERAYLLGAAAGDLVLSSIVLLSVLVLGIEQTENSTFPAYALAKTINIGNILQRVEGILITIWILTYFIKISVLFLSMLQGLRSIFGLKRQNHLIYPLAALFMIIAWNTYINTVYVNEIIATVWMKFSSIYLLIIPALLYIIALVRVKLLKQKPPGKPAEGRSQQQKTQKSP